MRRLLHLLIRMSLWPACLFMAGHTSANNRQYYFEKLNITDGLSQNTVNAILQDRTGFMWFGTKDGLNRYDGQSFQLFKKDYNDPNSLGNNFITALHEDKEGNIWIGTDAGMYLYDPVYELFTPFHLTTPEHIRIEKTVTQILSDDTGRIWIISEDQGIFLFEPEEHTLRVFSFPDMHSNIRTLMKDNSGYFWLSFYQGGLYYSTDTLATIHPFKDAAGQEKFKDEIISKIYPGTYNRLFISSEKEGVKEINLSTREVKRLPLSGNPDELIFVRDFIPYSDHGYWIGTESGLYIYHIPSQTTTHLTSSPYDPYSISDNAIYCLYKDKEDGLWIGSYFGGINYLPKQYSYFDKFYPNQEDHSLQGRRVREICNDNQGNLWIGTEDKGLYLFDPATKKFRFFEPSKDFTNVHGICMVGEETWVGTFSQGIKVIDKNRQLVKSYRKEEKANSLNDNSVFTIYRTTTGDVFLGTLFGFQRYRPESDDFENIDELTGVFVYDIREDSKGNIWLATYVNGAYKYDIQRKQWTHYMHNPEDSHSLPSNKVLSIFEDHKRNVWLTTQGGGLCRYEPVSGTFITYNSGNGFPGDVAYQILEDKNHTFWITTNNGLIAFNPDTQESRIYTTSNGLLSNQFNYKSSYMGDDGVMYLGSIDGLISFDLNTFTENKFIPPVVLTDFLIFNKKVKVNGKDSPLRKSITHSKEITLSSRQNSFSFRVAVLAYQASEMNKLLYKLEGFDKEWQPVGESPLINYSNISHGNYTFKIKGANSNGIWNEAETHLDIRILPPPYLSPVAYILYFFLAAGSFVLLIFYFRNRNRQKQERMMEIFNQEKERELYDSKIEFFTNVAHEIRTPLTLIKGPLDNIIKKVPSENDIKEDLDIMSKNTGRLLDLTNQLLDFRKTEIKGFQLTIEECNIVDLIKETYTRFQPLTREKNITFENNITRTEFYAHVDREAFIKIISNLFNNAIKYSARLVTIQLEAETGENPVFHILVENDGELIPGTMKEEIFKPFMRLNRASEQPVTGTGIGLALARSLAELHQGQLVLENKPDINCFRLTLPSVHEHAIVLRNKYDIIQPDEIAAIPEAEEKNNKPAVLVADDHTEMQSFIARQLKDQYTVYKASNGIEAIRILDTHYINLVISDIVMPQMDGYELCRKVKSDIQYSHIPVILLTAKTNIQSKVEGMEAGADIYMEKPFSNDYLIACVSNLIQSRAKLKEIFAQSPQTSINSMATTKPDEEFLNKLNVMIGQNMSNPNFSIDDMAEEFFMSRSSFYRKIKGILGMGPNEYLRLERLKKAARLLEEDEAYVNEVCYTVGFNSPSYFSKCFYKQFGVLPKDYSGNSVSASSPLT